MYARYGTPFNVCWEMQWMRILFFQSFLPVHFSLFRKHQDKLISRKDEKKVPIQLRFQYFFAFCKLALVLFCMKSLYVIRASTMSIHLFFPPITGFDRWEIGIYRHILWTRSLFFVRNSEEFFRSRNDSRMISMFFYLVIYKREEMGTQIT